MITSSDLDIAIQPGSVVLMYSSGQKWKHADHGLKIQIEQIPRRQLFFVVAEKDRRWLVIDQKMTSWITFDGATNLELADPNDIERA